MGRDLEFDAYKPRLLPSRALNPFGGGARASDATRPPNPGGAGGMHRTQMIEKKRKKDFLSFLSFSLCLWEEM